MFKFEIEIDIIYIIYIHNTIDSNTDIQYTLYVNSVHCTSIL